MCPETRGVLFAFSQRLSWAEGNPPVKFRPERGQVLPQLRCSWASVYLLVGWGDGEGRVQGLGAVSDASGRISSWIPEES